MGLPSGAAPEQYARRLGELQTEEARCARRSNRLGVAKLAAISLTIILAVYLAKYHPQYILVLFAPIALIVLLFVLHDRTLRALRRCRLLQAFYQRGIARLEDRWAGAGERGERFLDPAHPYARDLDLFGDGSLFQLLCTARTRAGEATLAAWLLGPAPVSEITARQSAVEELRPRLDFREKLALAGEDMRTGVRPEALLAWSQDTARHHAPPINQKFARIAAPLLAALWALSLLGWLILGWWLAALCISLLNLALTYRFRAAVDKMAAEIEAATPDLDLLASIFRIIETESFSTPKLAHLRSILTRGSAPASHSISRLSKRVDYLNSHDNWFVKIADPFVFWTLQWVSAIDRWRAQHGAEIQGWIAAVGELEALTALATYAWEHPHDTFPQFVEHEPYLELDAFAHPLIPRSRAVANDLKLDRALQLIVISGPNMAGKSTFIRSVGINVVLAQAGAPVTARNAVLSRLNVAASICVLDSLQGGLSRFYAEILRLKLIDEQSRGAAPVLFLLDELLSGTNSHDRRVGTESFVRSLLSRGAIGLVTTHDLALAEIADSMAGQAANFHFEDSFENGELRFDYRLSPGVVSTANALKLMRSVGLQV